MLNNISSSNSFDKFAIYLSVLCAVQCLILPISLLFIPAFSLLPLADESFHELLLLFVIPISAFAMISGCRKHKIYNIIFYVIAGLGIMIVSAVWGHDLFGETGEIVSTLVGTSILSFGHVKNRKLCKECCL
tara:strand:+ start:2395 stop:2790 length:396 start_codon:yes stop_codon:yes gene_type:complete